MSTHHNPPVRNQRFLTAPFTQGGLWGAVQGRGCGIPSPGERVAERMRGRVWNGVQYVTLTTFRWFRCLPAAVLSVTAQKVPKEAAQRGVERLAPARRATPPRPPQARTFVFASKRFWIIRANANQDGAVNRNKMETDGAAGGSGRLLQRKPQAFS